jgi:predicted MFS family arabinose efflux permease
LSRTALRTYGILFSLWLMVFTAASQTIIVTPILPIIGDELGVAESLRGLLVTVYSLTLASAAVVMGPISDRIGRRQVLLIGSGSLAVMLLLHGLVQSFAGLLFVRALAGAAGGMLSGAAVSYVGDYFPYARRGWATGWVMSGVAFGLVLGIPLGRVLAASASFRIPFLAFSGLMAAAFVLIWRVVPQPDVERESGRVTVLGSLRRYRDLLGVSSVRVASLAYFLMYLSLGLLVVYLPQWLTANFSLDVALFGRPLRFGGVNVDFIATLFLVGGTVSVLAGPWAGTLSDRIGRKPLILTSCLGLSVVTALLTYVVVERWVAYPLYIAIMGLFSMRMSPLQALLTALVPDRLRGTLLSLTIAAGQIGTGLGASVAGVTYAGWGYRATTWLSAISILLMAALVWGYLPEPGSPDAEESKEEVAAQVVEV